MSYLRFIMELDGGICMEHYLPSRTEGPNPILFVHGNFCGSWCWHNLLTYFASRGTSCYVRGAPRILDEIEKQLNIHEGETSPDLEYSLETVACIGACSLSPCIMINKKVEAKLNPKKIKELFVKADKG